MLPTKKTHAVDFSSTKSPPPSGPQVPAEPSLLTNSCEGINNTCQCGKLNLMEILRLFTLEKIDWDISNGQRFNFKENKDDVKNTLL